MKVKYRMGFLATVALLSGCASIADGKNQVLSVETRNKSVPVVGSNCKLTNDKGTWYVTAPGTTTVQRSYQDLNVQCEKMGMAPSVAAIKSSTKGMAFGNIIFGGVIGAGVDIASGAAYDYPSPITVEMNDLIESDRLSRPTAAHGSETKPSEGAEAVTDRHIGAS